MSLSDFASAMSQLDTSSIPPSRLRYAIRAHALKIMAKTIHDKPLGEQILVSHFDHLVQAALRKAD